MSETKLRRIQVLDRLYDFRPGSGEMAGFSYLIGGEHADFDEQRAWADVLTDLEREGMIMLSTGLNFDGYSALIKGPGRREVEDRRSRRSNVGLRRLAVRDAVISWISLNQRQPTTGMTDGGILLFEGDPFSSDELHQALRYLDEKGLIDGLRGDDTVMTAWLTAEGHDCVDKYGGSVSDYVRRGERAGTTNYVTVHGDNSGNIGWDSQTLTQTATTTGVARDELTTIVAALRQATGALGMGEDDEKEIGRHLDIVDAELSQAEPSKEVTTTFLRRAVAVVEKQTENALGLVLTAYVKWQMQRMGLPPL